VKGGGTSARGKKDKQKKRKVLRGHRVMEFLEEHLKMSSKLSAAEGSEVKECED
jgi:hypothetical protein